MISHADFLTNKIRVAILARFVNFECICSKNGTIQKIFSKNKNSFMQISISFIRIFPSSFEGPQPRKPFLFFCALLEVSPEIFCLSEPCGGRCHEDDNIFRRHTASLRLWRIQIKIKNIKNIYTSTCRPTTR